MLVGVLSKPEPIKEEGGLCRAHVSVGLLSSLRLNEEGHVYISQLKLDVFSEGLSRDLHLFGKLLRPL